MGECSRFIHGAKTVGVRQARNEAFNLLGPYAKRNPAFAIMPNGKQLKDCTFEELRKIISGLERVYLAGTDQPAKRPRPEKRRKLVIASPPARFL